MPFWSEARRVLEFSSPQGELVRARVPHREPLCNRGMLVYTAASGCTKSAPKLSTMYESWMAAHARSERRHPR
jgi:hypothetical protein